MNKIELNKQYGILAKSNTVIRNGVEVKREWVRCYKDDLKLFGVDVVCNNNCDNCYTVLKDHMDAAAKVSHEIIKNINKTLEEGF